MLKEKTCFMISPIGEEGTDVRREADDLLWIAQRALEKYNFQVVRVDQLPRPTVITNEIIQLIQESELCIIVLTGENPNVFYEAGRRHETGKPFIQLIRKGERLPFDVAGIRTIIYDGIDTLRGASKLIEDIQRYVEEFENTGYGATGTGVSLSTISATLDRIERKIGQLLISRSSLATLTSHQEELPGLSSLKMLLRDPKEVFMQAFLAGDFERAIRVLNRLKGILPVEQFVLLAGALAPVNEAALEMVILLLEEHLDYLLGLDNLDPVKIAVGSVCQFYIRVDREEEGLERTKGIFANIFSYEGISKKDLAFMKNQYQRLLYGAGRLEEALHVVEEAIQLDPEEASYLYNASLIYEKLGLLQKAEEMVDRYLQIGTEDDDHLHQAVEIYAKRGRIEDARKVWENLRDISPFKAILFDEDVRKALGISLPGIE